MRKSVLTGISVLMLLFACQQRPVRLPVLGNPEFRQVVRNGQSVTDTVYPAVPAFHFLDQDSNAVTSQSLDDKIYVADFIFLSCPTICPRITQAMRKVYAKYAGEDRLVFLSHTIDPQHDTIPRLRQYAQGLGVDSRKWHFLTGPQDSILNLAEHGYYTAAAPDSTAPGGFAHGGGLLLVDRHKHIRGVYNGTDSAETERLIRDIPVLLREQF